VLGVAVLIGAAAAALIFALASPGGRDLQPDSVIRVDPGTLRVTQVARVGDAPDLIVAAGGYLWVTNWILRDSDLGTGRNAGDLGLWRVDPATGRSEPVGGGVSPCGIAADPSGNVWVANCFAPKLRQSSNVTLVDAMTTKFKKTVLVPGGDNFFRGIAFGGGFLWLGRSPSASARVDTVWQVDPRLDGKLLGAVRIVHPPGALGWSSHYGDLWTTGFGDGSLTRIHPATGKVTTIEHAGVNPDWMAFADGSVWVADWSKPALVRLNETGPALPRSIPLPVANRRACLNVSCIWTVAAGAGAIWATTPRDRALWRIDPKTDRVRRISLPYEPAGVTVSAGEVWVTVRGR
jgi:sugar lactone lactonase YvrE